MASMINCDATDCKMLNDTEAMSEMVFFVFFQMVLSLTVSMNLCPSYVRLLISVIIGIAFPG